MALNLFNFCINEFLPAREEDVLLNSMKLSDCWIEKICNSKFVVYIFYQVFQFARNRLKLFNAPDFT